MAKNRNVRFTTDVGTAQWPHLNTPDTQFNKDGVFHVSLRLTKEQAEPLTNKMSEVLEEFSKTDRAKSKKTAPFPVKDVEDDDGNPTGEVQIKFKLNAVGINGADRWEQRPVLFDAGGKPMSENIGGGSRIKVGAEIVPYSTAMAGTGVTLRLKAVQVIELIEYTKGGGFDAWEFSKQEGFVTDGYSKEQEAKVEETADPQHQSGFDF
jgi:hypothetical protein|tara:strand:+ start:195 stop:818 length:624 start_codon:yes stop_codon:yes gene_type:complete